MGRLAASVVLLAAAQMGMPVAASAQLRAGQTVASFSFDLGNPGARGLGMGGAFAGVADDATAAYSNPAALVILARPEISFEQRAGITSVEFLSWGTTKTFDGDELTSYRFDAARRRHSSTTRAGSFGSVAYGRERGAVALYWHQLAFVQGHAGFKRGEIFERPLDVRSSVSLDVMGVGLSGALRLTDTLSAGATVVGYRGRIRVSEKEFLSGTDLLRREHLSRVDDSDLSFNLGLLADPEGPWSIGAYYRDGATFSVVEEELPNFRPPPRNPPPEPSPLELPDAYGVGVGYRVTDHLLASFEWSRVVYSRLNRVETLGADYPDTRLRSDDADELRLGFEYSFWEIPLAPAVRLGVWSDPAHSLRAVGAATPCPGATESGELFFACHPSGSGKDESAAMDAASKSNGFRKLFPGGEGRLHVTGGVGLVQGRRYQVDSAFDCVSSRCSMSVSAVIRF